MKKYINKIGIITIITLILGVVSGIYMYKKIDNTSQDILLKYVSSKKSEEEGLDLIEVYSAIAEGYNDEDNIIGEDVYRVLVDSVKDYVIKIVIISFVVVLVSIYGSNILISCAGIIIILISMYILPKYEIDLKYKHSYESISNYIDSLNDSTVSSYEAPQPEPLKPLYQISNNGFINQMVKNEQGDLLYTTFRVPKILNAKDYEELVYIDSINSNKGELEYKFVESESDDNFNTWNVKLAIRIIDNNANDININLKSKLDESFNLSLEVEVPNEYSNIDPYKEFDYYNNRYTPFSEEDIYNIKSKIEGLSIVDLNISNHEIDGIQHKDSYGNKYINMRIKVNIPLDSSDGMTSMNLNSYVGDIERFTLEHGYNIWIIEIIDVNNEVVYSTENKFY